MSRVSRRKTLSHSEIENFLSEINVEQKQSLPVETMKPLSGQSSSTEMPSIDPMRTEVQSIRDFCKVCSCSILILMYKVDAKVNPFSHRQHSKYIAKESRWNQTESCVTLGARFSLVQHILSCLPVYCVLRTICILLLLWKEKSLF